MRDYRPVVTALFESAITAGPASGALWTRLTEDTAVLREHLEYLRGEGQPPPGDPALIAAAMGADDVDARLRAAPVRFPPIRTRKSSTA